ncbi:hypothetical protein FQR65_LT08017 [Abscondita terminalis]|nr:hypothetical protein FQR65_LT08017 [Abscondita terminalis]
MSDVTTITCGIYLGKIKQEPEFEPNHELMPRSKLMEQDVNIDNPIADNRCKIEIDSVQLHSPLVKEEFQQELLDDGIKSESIIDDDFVLFNTDIPLIKEESIPVNIFYCYQCNYGSSNKKTLTDHIFSHRLKCNRCSFATFDNYSLITHNLKVHSNSFSCKYECRTKLDLTKRKRIHKDDDPFSCENVDYKTFTESSMQKRSNEKQFKCNLCDYLCNFSNNLKLHSMKHSGEQLFSCDKCNYKSYSNYNLRRHKIIHSNEKQFKCRLCDYRCNFLYNLKNHLIKHSGERLFTCDKCDYQSYSNYNLRRHKIIHTNEKQFSCDKCDYKTYNNSDLRKHKLIHSKEKHFKCSVCDYRCNFSSNLKIHLMKHTNEQPFSCDKCNYKTYTDSNLRQHKITHSIEKPFSCDKCDYKTCTNSDLQRHKFIHSKEKRFQCNLCDYRCNFSSNFKKHLKKH